MFFGNILSTSSIAILFISLSLATRTRKSETVESKGGRRIHHQRHQKLQDSDKEQGILAELYYHNQKRERQFISMVNEDILKYNPNYPCLFGVNVLGDDSKESIIDGHKYSCGLQSVENAIVYSFGSNRDERFERAVLRLRFDANISIFELDENLIPKDGMRNSAIQYFNIALAYRKNEIVKSAMTLAEIMKFKGE